MSEDVRDPVVAEHYREFATEAAPAALNQAVLREARQHSGNRYSQSVFWLRPMAWAASIGLCLAIVLELSSIPQQEPAMMSVPAPAPAAPAARIVEAEAADGYMPVMADDAIAESDMPATAKDAIGATEITTSANRAEPGVIAERVEQPVQTFVDADGRVRRNDLAQREKAESVEEVIVQSDEFAAVDAPTMQELESLNRMREGSNVSEIPEGGALAQPAGSTADMAGEAKQAPLRSFASAIAPAAEMAADTACGTSDRETPEAWLACIEGLETDGMTEIAQREREQLQEAYPDVEMP